MAAGETDAASRGSARAHQTHHEAPEREGTAPGAAEDAPAKPLTGREHADAEERSAVGPQVVHEAIRREGEEELRRANSALAWSGLAAGLSMGFSLAAEGLLRQRLPDVPWRPLVTSLGYPVGFLLVVLGRQQLFTENTLTAVLPLLTRRDIETLRNVARLWAIVLVANLLGTLAFAWTAARSATFEPAAREAFLSIGLEALGEDPAALFVKGLFAGWLIALMVWMLPAAEGGRVLVIVVLTYLIGVAGFPHVIAGSAEALYVTLAGPRGAGEYVGWLLPTLAGNVVGGVTLVAALNHAQVVAGKRR